MRLCRISFAGVLLAGVLLAEVAAVTLLHRLGSAPWAHVSWRDAGSWLATTPVETAAVALLRPVALALAWYLLATTVLHVGARLAPRLRLAALTTTVTPPGVRRLIDRAVAVSLLAASAVPTAAAHARPLAPAATVHAVAATEATVPGLTPPPGPATPDTPPSSPPRGAAGEPAESASTPQPDPAAQDTAERSVRWVVEPGDHLWSIAARTVAEHRGVPVRDLAPRQIAPYWVRVVAANRDRLPSDDVDLVYPGDVVVLPAP